MNHLVECISEMRKKVFFFIRLLTKKITSDDEVETISDKICNRPTQFRYFVTI